jgi:hypothetical protein
MKRVLLLLALIAIPLASVRADDAPPQNGCGLVSALLIAQDQGTVTIACSGVSPEFGTLLAGLLTDVLQRKLDPRIVAAKLDEIEAAPEAGVARTFDSSQRQLVIKELVGKPGQEIAIAADPTESDAGDFAKDIATPLQMVGWQIAGNQITRKALPGFEDVPGVVLIVRDPNAPPEKARELKGALTDAHLVVPLLADPKLAPDAAVLWIGKRPSFNPTGSKS